MAIYMAICTWPSPSLPTLQHHVPSPSHGLGKLLLCCAQLFLQPGGRLLHGRFNGFLDAPEIKQKQNGQCESSSKQKQNGQCKSSSKQKQNGQCKSSCKQKPQSPKHTPIPEINLNPRNKPSKQIKMSSLRLRPSSCLLRAPGLWLPPLRLTPGLCLPDARFIAMALGAILLPPKLLEKTQNCSDRNVYMDISLNVFGSFFYSGIFSARRARGRGAPRPIHLWADAFAADLFTPEHNGQSHNSLMLLRN